MCCTVTNDFGPSCRVDWHTLHLVLRKIEAQGASSDVLIVAADSLPGADWSLRAFLDAAKSSGQSAVILQRPAVGSMPRHDGPRILAHFGGDGDIKRIIDIAPSSGSPPRLACTSALHMPVVFYLTAADVHSLLEADVASALHATLGAPNTGDAAGVAAEALIPVEACLGHLARNGRLGGIVCPGMWILGAADGRPHAIPAGPHAPSPFAHALPAILSYGAGSSAVAGGEDPSVIHTRSYARVGVMGNPSDGYGGKTLSVTIANFKADCWLTPNSQEADARITLLPHPFSDPLHFGGIGHVSTLVSREGYSGGIRLMMAAVYRFSTLAASKGVKLSKRGFTLRYHTTVPRQVGLAGSSALVTAMVRALMRHYGFGEEAVASQSLGLGRDTLPNFVLAIENEELGIVAGLQDRVVQAYEGAVHMDFTPSLLKELGHGKYSRIPVNALPPLFLAYAADPSDSGRIHAPVKQRWLAGDKEVVDGMNAIASLADDAFGLCTSRPYGSAPSCTEAESIAGAWARLMAANFDGRRKLFGDPALGKDNIRMIEIARETGASGKFPGSGGAILGVVDVAGIEAAGNLVGAPGVPPADAPVAAHAEAAARRVAAGTAALRAAYHAEGYVFVRLQPVEAPAQGAGHVTV